LTALLATVLLAWLLPALAHAAGAGSATARVTAGHDGASVAHAARTRAQERAARRRAAARKRRKAQLVKERRSLERRIKKNPSLILNSKVRLRMQATGARLPLTLRLRRPYEAFPGDDTLQLTFDDGAIPWPLPGTVKPAPVTTSLDGSVTMEADYGADVSAYPELGTVETIFGGGISMTSTGFQVADQDPAGCTTAKSITVTAGAYSSSTPRFGILNPFSRKTYGTIDLRPTLRVVRTACDDSTTTWDVVTGPSDRALPVAFEGDFRVSPGVASDGKIRWGVVTVNDAVTPQRTTFGMVNACTDPAAPDGCDRKAFPVRTKLVSMVAEVLVGDAMPPAATLP
jgi:hypothetical protein